MQCSTDRVTLCPRAGTSARCHTRAGPVCRLSHLRDRPKARPLPPWLIPIPRHLVHPSSARSRYSAYSTPPSSTQHLELQKACCTHPSLLKSSALSSVLCTCRVGEYEAAVRLHAIACNGQGQLHETTYVPAAGSYPLHLQGRRRGWRRAQPAPPPPALAQLQPPHQSPTVSPRRRHREWGSGSAPRWPRVHRHWQAMLCRAPPPVMPYVPSVVLLLPLNAVDAGGGGAGRWEGGGGPCLAWKLMNPVNDRVNGC